MGQIVAFECGDCRFSKTVYTGSGMFDNDVKIPPVKTGSRMKDYHQRKPRELYNCPRCGYLSLRSVKYELSRDKGSCISSTEKKQKCSKCGSLMVWAEGSKELTCPNCHSNNCICLVVGQWD